MWGCECACTLLYVCKTLGQYLVKCPLMVSWSKMKASNTNLLSLGKRITRSILLFWLQPLGLTKIQSVMHSKQDQLLQYFRSGLMAIPFGTWCTSNTCGSSGPLRLWHCTQGFGIYWTVWATTRFTTSYETQTGWVKVFLKNIITSSLKYIVVSFPFDASVTLTFTAQQAATLLHPVIGCGLYDRMRWTMILLFSEPHQQQG